MAESVHLELYDLKYVFNYVSEAIVVSDQNYKIAAINDAAVAKLKLNKDTISLKNLMDFIPDGERYKVEEAIENETSDYYEIILKRENGELFPALVSGSSLLLKDKKYRVSTILDVTELKEKEQELLAKSKDQVRKLKKHIISKTSSEAQEINKVKLDVKEEIANLNEKLSQNESILQQTKRKAQLLEQENESLLKQIELLKENSFDFDDVLELEISKAKIFNLKFSVALIEIDKFEKLTKKLKTQYKQDIVTNAIKRQFRNSLRGIDTVSYDKDGRYFVIMPNSAEVNITDLIKRLVIPKDIEDNIVIDFNYGLAHFYQKDTSKALLYRCEKNLEAFKKEKALKEEEEIE